MGVTFDQIIGPRSTWELPGSYKAHKRHKKLQAFRLSEIPMARNRTTKIYVRYNAAGSATGGAGLGTLVAPYLVRHTADLKALTANVIALLGTNVGVVFFDDDVIPGSVANTDQSTVAWGANISFGRSNDGTRKPEISGFVNVAGAVVAAGIATYTHAAITSCWVRGRLSGSTTRDDYRLQPYILATSHALMLATPYSFYPVAGTTEVNYGSHDPTKLELTFNTGAGFQMGDLDQTCVDGLIVEGFGMDVPGTAGGGQCIKFGNTGTNTGLCRDCDSGWGPYHVSGHFAGGGTGGIVTFHNCRGYFHQWDGSNNGDIMVAFATGGAHECGRYSCTQICGGLDTTGAGVRTPTTPYAHSSDDVNSPISYLAEIDCIWVPDPYGLGIVTNTMCPSVGTITNVELQTSYRVYCFRRQTVATGGTYTTLWGIHIAETFYFSVPPPGGTDYPFGAGILKGLFFSCDELHISTGDWTAKNVKQFGSASNHDFRWLHCRRRFTGTNTQAIYENFEGTQLGTCSDFNGVYSIENGVTAGNVEITTSPFANHFRRTDPTASQGGIRGMAYRGLNATQFTGLTGIVALAAAGDWASAATVPASCVNTAQPIPATLACEFDYLGNTRNPNPALRSIGPYEANPVPESVYASSGSARTRDWRTRLPR